MSAFLGRDVLYEVILERDTRPKVNGAYEAPVDTYVTVGGRRGASKEATWDTTDATHALTPGAVRQELVTFLAISGSLDGVYENDDAENVIAFEDYVNNPPSGQPYGWLRRSVPLADGSMRVEELYCLFSSFSNDDTFDDVSTYTTNYTGQQPVIKTIVPAP